MIALEQRANWRSSNPRRSGLARNELVRLMYQVPDDVRSPIGHSCD
jgi:hypothetical protein